MRSRPIGIMIVGAGSVLLLGGCTTVPRYSYYQVPCSVPGAVPATPLAQPGHVSVVPPSGAPAGALAGQPASRCIVPVSESGYSYYPGYRNYGYGLGGYGSSFGVGIGFGSGHHRRGGHHGGHRRH